VWTSAGSESPSQNQSPQTQQQKCGRFGYGRRWKARPGAGLSIRNSGATTAQPHRPLWAEIGRGRDHATACTTARYRLDERFMLNRLEHSDDNLRLIEIYRGAAGGGGTDVTQPVQESIPRSRNRSQLDLRIWREVMDPSTWSYCPALNRCLLNQEPNGCGLAMSGIEQSTSHDRQSQCQTP